MSSEISRLLSHEESETLEFKGPGAHVDALARSVCGMLNQQGGIVVWGVGNDRSVIGVRDAERRSRELNDFLVQQIRPRPLISVSCQSLGRQNFVVVNVPQGADKPYSLQREISVRVGSATHEGNTRRSLQELSRRVLRNWIGGSVSQWLASRSVDCSSEELKSTRQELADKGRFGVDVPTDDEELLQRLSLFRSGQFTNGAVVLFATQPIEWLTNASIRLSSYVGDHSGEVANDTTSRGRPFEWSKKRSP